MVVCIVKFLQAKSNYPTYRLTTLTSE